MANRKHVLHIKSSVVEASGQPKKPAASDLLYGEIAVNYGKGAESVMIKNSDDEIVSFVNENKFNNEVDSLKESERVASAALNDLNSRVETSENDIDTLKSTTATAAALNDLNDRTEELLQTVAGTTALFATRIDALEEDVTKLISITYSELVGLRNSSMLQPGRFYRITDYVTTTIQTNTRSAGHAFDIIVLATSPNTLNENAKAISHENDTYFEFCNLNAWEIKYDLDNNISKFAWADDENGKGVIYYMKDELNNECYYDFKNIQFKRWAITDIQNTNFVGSDLTALKRDFVYKDDGSRYSSRYAYKPEDITHGSTKFIVGAGDEENFGWYYTFSTIKYMSSDTDKYKLDEIEDASVGTEFFDFGSPLVSSPCYGNVIEPLYNNNDSDIYDGNGGQVLNNIVLNAYYDYVNVTNYTSNENYFGYGCANMSTGYGCTNNTFGQNCKNSIFGYDSSNNTFGQGCYDNTFAHACTKNTFGQICYNNTFGNTCQNNIFGNNSMNNTFGQNCGDNIFGNACTNNTFGNTCHMNTFGQRCTDNSFGTDCDGNTFGHYCTHNYLESYVQYNILKGSDDYNTLREESRYNIFESACDHISLTGVCSFNYFGAGCRYITIDRPNSSYNIVETGNQWITLKTNQGIDERGLRNITIAQGVNTDGDESNLITITHETLNDEFKTTYQKTASQVKNL